MVLEQVASAYAGVATALIFHVVMGVAMKDETLTFGNAVKAARRAIFTSTEPYSVYVLCANNAQAAFAWDELQRMLSAGSLKVRELSHAKRRVTTERAGSFQVVDMAHNPHALVGLRPSHYIWLYEPSIGVKSVALGHLKGGSYENASL